MKQIFGDVSYRRLIAAVSAATARPTGRLGGFPTGRPWDFAVPNPFLGSASLHQPLPARSRGVGPTKRLSGDSLPAVRHATGGDTNPDGHWGRFPRPLVSGGLVAGRRFPPCPQLIASHGILIAKTGLRIRSFSFFAGRFRVRRQGEFRTNPRRNPTFFTITRHSYPRRSASIGMY